MPGIVHGPSVRPQIITCLLKEDLVSAPRAFVVVLVVAELFVCFFSSLEIGSSESEHETLAAFRTRNRTCHLYLVFGRNPAPYAIILAQGLGIIRYD